MKLSELMRKGAKDTYQIFDDYFERNEDNHVVGCCALGAALYATGTFHVWDEGQIKQVILDATGVDISKPDNPLERRPLMDVITSLNDDDKATVEEIAHWLEGLGL